MRNLVQSSFLLIFIFNIWDNKRFNNFFNRIEKKTNVGKDTILKLAQKLQENDLKNEDTLREVIQELSKLTGKDVSVEKQNKIIDAVKNDKIPKDLDKMI